LQLGKLLVDLSTPQGWKAELSCVSSLLVFFETPSLLVHNDFVVALRTGVSW